MDMSVKLFKDSRLIIIFFLKFFQFLVESMFALTAFHDKMFRLHRAQLVERETEK